MPGDSLIPILGLAGLTFLALMGAVLGVVALILNSRRVSDENDLFERLERLERQWNDADGRPVAAALTVGRDPARATPAPKRLVPDREDEELALFNRVAAAPPEPELPPRDVIYRPISLDPAPRPTAADATAPDPTPWRPARPERDQVLQDFAAQVNGKFAAAADFTERYGVLNLEPLPEPGTFQLRADNGAYLWAAPLGEHRYLLLPGRDAVRHWSYLAAMKGSNAQEQFNDAFDLLPGLSFTLQKAAEVVRDADGVTFRISARGAVSGVTD